MIASDQPTILGSGVIVRVSSVEDGNMRFNQDNQLEIVKNRRRFLNNCGIKLEQTSLVQVIYTEGASFTRYSIVTSQQQSEGMAGPACDLTADALVVTEARHALFLPLADCVGVVLYDPITKVLMLSHIGRHSVENYGASKSVEYLVLQCQVKPADLKVWLSPAVGQATYPLYAFNNQGLHEVIISQLVVSGVNRTNIEASQVDTASDQNYFSHSQFIQGKRLRDGRFAVVAMMR